MRAPVVLLLGLLAAGPACAAAAQARVVAAGGAITEIVHALGEGERLVGVDTTSTWPDSARTLPKVGYLRSLSAEGLLSLAPSLLLASDGAGPPPVLAQVEAAGVRVRRLPSVHGPDGLAVNVRAVAAALGVPERGETLARELSAQWAQAAAAVTRMAGSPRVLFILSHAAAPMASGSGTAADAMIGLAGARNAVDGFEGYKPLTAEAAVVAAPDVILTTREGLAAIGGVEALLRRPGLALTPAARSRRVVAVDALRLLGFGPRLPDTVVELAQALRAPPPELPAAATAGVSAGGR